MPPIGLELYQLGVHTRAEKKVIKSSPLDVDLLQEQLYYVLKSTQ